MPTSRLNGYTFTTYPVPPAGFNPASASDADLQRYGIPSFAGAPPALTDRWYARIRPPYRIAVPTFSAFDSQGRDWSGGIVKPLGQRITWAEASCAIPTPSLPAGAAPGSSCSVSLWIGIDGDIVNVLFQAGCLLNVATNGEVETIPFFEWFPETTIKIGNVPLATNDELSIYMCALGDTAGTVLFCNDSANVLIIFSVAAYNTKKGVLSWDGTSAEWIVESQETDTDFTAVRFANCNAGDDDGNMFILHGPSSEKNQNARVQAVVVDSSTVGVTHL